MESHGCLLSVWNSSYSKHNKTNDENIDDARDLKEAFLEEHKNGYDPTHARDRQCEGSVKAKKKVGFGTRA